MQRGQPKLPANSKLLLLVTALSVKEDYKMLLKGPELKFSLVYKGGSPDTFKGIIHDL